VEKNFRVTHKLLQQLEIALLGPLQVRLNGQEADFRTDAERALLVYLAAYQGQAQRRDTLAGLLSPERADVEALTYLRNRLTRLRSAIGDEQAGASWLDLDRKQITLRASEQIQVDLTQFEQLLKNVERHPHRQVAGCPSCLDQLQQAIHLLRGEFLAGLNFPSEPWQTWLGAQREHYHLRALDAISQLRDAQAARGEWAAVLDLAQRQLALEPWAESAHRASMLAYYQLGDRNAALAQYAQCERILDQELGVEPEAETQQLRQQITDDHVPIQASTHIPDNLTAPSSRFIGRQHEQSQLLQRLANPNYRLISIVGAGGVGKTRLAIEVGQQIKTSYPDGVWFVALDNTNGEPEQIKIAIGEAMGLAQGGKQLSGEQVLTILRDKQALIILDNCEPVLEQLDFIPAWLKRAPQLSILASSREPLNFQGEAVLLLGPLPSGDNEIGDAEAMFAEHGQRAWDGFSIDQTNLAQVQQICQLVDGTPLGIALAAAWVRRRSLPQIAHEIRSSLDFLSTRLRDIDPRHRSMRAMFETSWQLLDEQQQNALAVLSVFNASFDAQAAAALGASQDQLDLLCEKSLLQQQPQAERYHMHSLLRQFASDKLADALSSIEQRYVAYFAHYAQQHQHNYQQLQPEWRNLSAAVQIAHKLGEWQSVLDLVQHLSQAWQRQMRFSDMREALSLALDAAQHLQNWPLLAQNLLQLGEIETELSNYAQAEQYLLKAQQQFMQLEDDLQIAQCCYLLGRINDEQAQDEQALSLFEQSKQLFELHQHGQGIAKNLNMIAVYQVKKYRDFETAQRYSEQALALQQNLPRSSTYIETLRNLARITGWADNYAQAEYYLAEAASSCQQLGDIGEHAAVLYEQVLLSKRRQQYDNALHYGQQSLESFKQVGSLRWQALIQTQLGLLHQAKQDYQQAEHMLQQSLQIFGDLGDNYEQAYSYYYLATLHAETGNSEQSQIAKQHAQRLNQELNDPQLKERLA
jgi:predicted ATPase/DNA-binding SARP family transcriptional activator